MVEILRDELPRDEQLEVNRKIDVSPLFVHLVADAVIVLDLGRDVELALTRITSRPVERHEVKDEESERYRIKFEAGVAEVARVRMAPEVAIQLAMQVLLKMIDDDRIDVAALQKMIGEISEKSVKAEVDDG